MPDRILLRLLNGPRAGESFEVPASGLLVGRRDGNDLQLEDASLSGRHAFLRADGQQVQVEDLGSTNGTKIDGEKVERGSAAIGSVLTLGKVKLAVLDGAQDASPAAAATATPASSEPAPAQAQAGGDFAIEGFDEDEIVLGDEPAATSESAPDPAVETAVPGIPARAIPAELTQTAPESKAPPAAPPPQPADLGEPEESLELDVEAAMARGGRSFVLPLIAAVLLLGFGAWSMFAGGEDEQARDDAVAVSPLAGNRLASEAFSFEPPDFDERAWIHEESAPRRLDRGRSFAASGRFGAGLVLDAGDWARLTSEWFDVNAGDTLSAEATAFAGAGCIARVGIEFGASDREGLRTLSLPASAETSRIVAASSVPAGWTRARVVLLAGTEAARGSEDEAPREIGEVGFDDVYLGPAESSVLQLVREDESTLERVADGAATLSFDRLGRRLVVLRAARGPLGATPTPLPLELRPGELEGETLTVGFGSASGSVVLIAELLPELFGEGVRSVGTVTPAGYRESSGEFSADDVERLRFGSGLEQLAVLLPEPARVNATPSGEGLRVAIELGAAREFELQLGFTADRGEAATLAAKARRAERDGELGNSLARWEQLLASYPFEAELADEAKEAFAALSEIGLAELGEVQRDLERARFFQLGQLFDECAQRATAVAARFGSDAPSPNAVELAAEALLAEIDRDRKALPMRSAGVAELRSKAIRGYLEASGRSAVAGHLEPSSSSPGGND